MKKDDLVFGIRFGTLEVLILLLVLLAAFLAIVTFASALTYVNDPPDNVSIRRIDQGGCVQLGETIDISGIGWYTGSIAYYGKYYNDYAEGDNLTLQMFYGVQPWQLRKFYIDPKLFKDYQGWWYAHYSAYERGNSRLFRISSVCNVSEPENKTVVLDNKTVLITTQTSLPKKSEPGIDYIISRNEETIKGAPDKSHYWIFGNYNGDYYDIPTTKGLVTFTKNLTNDLPAGDYDILFIDPGENKILETTYNKTLKMLSSPLRSNPDIDISLFTQDRVEQKIIERTDHSIDDTYRIWKVALQNPSVEIRGIRQEQTSDKLNAITLAGYTNANPGDIIKIELDKGEIDSKLARQNIWTTPVEMVGGNGTYRTWNVSFLLDISQFKSGQHSFTISTDAGASMGAPVYFRKELAEHYQPEQYLQFVDNNPFVPTPTPEPAPPPVIQTVTVVQTQIVIQTEKIPVDYVLLIENAIPYIIVGIIGFAILGYVIFIVLRAFVRMRKRKYDMLK